MDRSRTDISERVRDLYEHDERNRNRSRMLGVLGTLFFLVAAIGTFYWFYDQRATEEFERIDVRELMAHDDFAGAAMAYTEFVRKFPLTGSVASAEAELQQIEAARQRFEAQRANERAVKQHELERIRTNYQREWQRHRTLFLDGKPEQSLEVLERVRELITVAGAPEDVEWALEQQVEHTWGRLRDYLATASRLAAEFDEATVAQDWTRARAIALELDTDYENTAAAARVPVPVEVRTRPAGALLLLGGKPLARTVDGEPEPLRTPTVVLCADTNGVVELVTELPGFAPRKIELSAREQASVEVVLAVVPELRIEFPRKLQIGIGMGQEWLATVLRGGRIGVARIDGSSQRVVALPGLKEADGAPLVHEGCAYFASNENTIECIDLESGQSVEGWPVPLPHGAATALTVGRGRVAVIDDVSVLHCWEQGTGKHLWALALDGAAAGPPTIQGRRMFVAATDGRVFLIDLTDGSVPGILRCNEEITTRVLSDGDTITFGSRNGTIRVVDVATGRVVWQARAGDAIQDGNLALGREVVCAASGGLVTFWSRATGERLGSLSPDGELLPGMALRGETLYLPLRREGERRGMARHVLQAIDVRARAVAWEFTSDGAAHWFAASAAGAVFASSDESVVVFR